MLEQVLSKPKLKEEGNRYIYESVIRKTSRILLTSPMTFILTACPILRFSCIFTLLETVTSFQSLCLKYQSSLHLYNKQGTVFIFLVILTFGTSITCTHRRLTRFAQNYFSLSSIKFPLYMTSSSHIFQISYLKPLSH